MDVRTHLGIDRTLCGEPVEVSPGLGRVVLTTQPTMAADARGLVHGGFVFGAVDYAAMLAVNHPNVVLGACELRFTAPVSVGELVHCEARVVDEDRRKRTIEVVARVDEKQVLVGRLTAFVLDDHVLANRQK